MATQRTCEHRIYLLVHRTQGKHFYIYEITAGYLAFRLNSANHLPELRLLRVSV